MGVGLAMLRHVLRRAVEQGERTSCVGVVADAKAEAVAFYERYGFVPLRGVVAGQLHGEPTPMFLPIRTVRDALKTTS